MTEPLKESLSKVIAKEGYNKKLWKHDLTRYIQRKTGSESIKIVCMDSEDLKDNRAKDKRGAQWNVPQNKSNIESPCF